MPANTFRATASASDANGSAILYAFTLEQLHGKAVLHMTPKEIGPKGDNSKTFTTLVGTPPQAIKRVVERPANVAIFRNVPVGRWRVTVEVTDRDNLLCKDNLPAPADLDDNVATSEKFVVAPLPDFVFAVSNFGNGKQLWYQAEDVDVADGLFTLGEPGGWGIVNHPAAFGGASPHPHPRTFDGESSVWLRRRWRADRTRIRPAPGRTRGGSPLLLGTRRERVQQFGIRLRAR